MGLGQLGLAPAVLYDMTFREFGNAMAGHYHEIEQEYQQHWERARWMAAIIVAPHSKKKIKPQDLAEFPWEQSKKPVVDGLGILRQIAKGHG